MKVLSVFRDDVDSDADAVDPDNDADVVEDAIEDTPNMGCDAVGKIARMTSFVRLCHRPAVGRQIGWDGMGRDGGMRDGGT